MSGQSINRRMPPWAFSEPPPPPTTVFQMRSDENKQIGELKFCVLMDLPNNTIVPVVLRNSCKPTFFYFVLWPTNAQLFHKTSHSYMFRHYWVFLRGIIVSALLSYTKYVNAHPSRRVLLEKLTGPQIVKKFPVFYETLRFINVFTKSRPIEVKKYVISDRISTGLSVA